MDSSQQESTTGAVDPPHASQPPVADFAALIDRHQTPLLRYARSLINAAADAEDIVQEAFLRLHRQHSAGGEAIQNTTSWLYRVTHNLAMDWRRKKLRRANSQDTLVNKAHADAQHNQPTRAVEDLVQKETVSRAMRELESLPEPQRQIIRLKVVDGLTLRQISDVLDLSVGNVYYRLNQGLADLARKLRSTDTI